MKGIIPFETIDDVERYFGEIIDFNGNKAKVISASNYNNVLKIGIEFVDGGEAVVSAETCFEFCIYNNHQFGKEI